MGLNFRAAASQFEEESDAGSVGGRGLDLDQATGPQEPESVVGDETPASCSYCGSTEFADLTDNGRVRQATCAACGGTMSAHPGAQWTPELIGDPSNHPKPNGDPRSGGVGGVGAAGVDPLVRDTSRLGAQHVAGEQEDEQVRQAGLPLLHSTDSHEERVKKLTHHYEHLAHGNGDDDVDYLDGYHPLSVHHKEHGVPTFRADVHYSAASDMKAPIASHLSRHIARVPPPHVPTVDITSPRYDGNMKENTLAYHHHGDNRIAVSSRLAMEPEHQSHGKYQDRDWFSESGDASTLDRTMTHEYGHLLDHQRFNSDDNGYEGGERRGAMLKELSQHIPGAKPFPGGYGHGANASHWMSQNREHIVNHVGTYAATNDHELVAELYAQHHHSPSPSEAARAVGRHLEGHHDDGAAHAREAARAAARASAEGADAGSRGSNREGQATTGRPAAGVVLAKLSDPEMHEVLTRFGHDHRTGGQYQHREHTLTPVKHAGFKGYVEGYDGQHEDNMEDDRGAYGSRHPNGGFDEDLYDSVAPEMDTHEREHYEEHGELPDQDDYDQRHDDAYTKAKSQKERDVKPMAHHGGVYHMLANHGENGYQDWHDKGEVHDVDLSQHHVYATQPHVVDKHVNRYVQNPRDTVLHVQQHGENATTDSYPGTHHPMFIKHENNLFTVEGHHRTASALLRKEPVRGIVYDADKHGFPDYDEPTGYDPHEGLQRYSALMRIPTDCDFTFDNPHDELQHAIRHHDDGVCTATELVRHSEARRTSKTGSVDWCAHRRNARCTFPGDSSAVSLAIPQDRGPCPWTTPWEQQVCPISEPGPMALMQAKGSKTLSWDEIGERHPHVYGDSEIHGEAADGADGPGIGDAANYLANERPEDPDAENSSVHDLDFHEETVHPRHIDYSPSGVNDDRVTRAREGYQRHPEEMPPLVLVHRHGVYQVADGHHRAEAAHGLDVPVKAYVAHSPYPDEPFRDGDKAPFYRAKPKTAMPSRNGPSPEGMRFETGIDPYQHENEETHPGWSHQQIYAHTADGKPGYPAGILNYSKTPEDHPNPTVAIHMIKTYPDHRGKGVASAMMDELRRQHPSHMFDHGAKSPSGKAFWNNYDDPGDPQLNLDHPDNAEKKDVYRPTQLARDLAGKDLSFMGSLSVPHAYEMARVARKDPEFAFHVTAAWSDVRNKAKRIRAEGKVVIKVATNEGLAGEVQGDHGTYENMITYRPGSRKIADWHCSCKWGDWAWDRIRFHGRQCSHSLAMIFEAQSRGMFGQEVKLGALTFGEAQEPDEVPGFSAYPIVTIAANLVDQDEDPASIMKLLMAYGLTHSSANSMLQNTLLFAKESVIQVEADQERMCQQCGHMLEEDATRCPVCNAEVKDDFPDTFHDAALHEAHDPVYLRFGHWPDDERSHNNVTGYKEEGVSVYDLDHQGHPLDPDSSFSRGHEHDEHCEPDCDMHLDNEDYGNDTREEMEGRAHRAERNRYNGVDRPSETGHLVRGEMVGIGHDGEPLLRKVKRVGDWIDHKHHFFPDSEPHRLARHPQDEDYEHPEGIRHQAAESEEDKRRRKHHRTNDTRRHAPNFGYGIPGWIGLPIGTCGQCSGWGCGHCGGTGQVAQDGNGNTADAVPDQNGDEGPMISGGISDTSSLRTAKESGPTVSGVFLKAQDTGRILMLQRGLDDEKDPAGGTWEAPGGHHEEGDKTSLHAGIREWEEEVGQPFPEGGVVHHTWTSPNGIYQGHVVVIPSEKDLRMHDGRVLPNPDDPKGDNHEQAAWWDIDHARKNPALREELKTGTPWKDIAKAGTEKTASSWDALSGEDDTPGFPYAAPTHSNSKNPASSGWATSEDPKSWDFANQVPDHLLPSGSYDSGGYYGMLHDEPEGALPSTDGDRDDLSESTEDHPETHGSIADTEGSLTPNQFTGSVHDILSQFQATAGARAIENGGLKDNSSGDIASAAQAHLKTALKDFDFIEQQELINEGKRDDVRARNFGNLQIEGTHYEALSRALGLDEEDPEDLFS